MKLQADDKSPSILHYLPESIWEEFLRWHPKLTKLLKFVWENQIKSAIILASSIAKKIIHSLTTINNWLRRKMPINEEVPIDEEKIPPDEDKNGLKEEK